MNSFFHYNTKNKSFLKVAKQYKAMGIENYNFMLQLNNPALLDVDPLDPNLDFATQYAIFKEVRENQWYYFREIARIPTGGSKMPFQAHRGNIAILWAMGLNINILVLLPRQTGKTSSILNWYGWDFDFGTINTEYLLFGLREKFLKENLEKFRNIRDSRPSYLKLNSKIDRENVSEIRFNLGDGQYNLIGYTVPPSSEEKAKVTARGNTKPRMFIDEGAFVPYIHISYPIFIFAFLQVAQTAKANKSSYGITMTTTAGYLNQEEGRWFYNKMQEAAPFDEKLFDMVYESPIDGTKYWDRRSIIDYILNNSKVEKEKSEFTSYLKIEFQWFEMGYTEEWLNTLRSAVSDDDFRREVLGEWQDSTTNHPYGQDRIRELQSRKIRPCETVVISNIFLLRFYRDMTEEDYNIPFIIGMDSGGNIGNDFSTLVVLDPTNYEVVAVMRSNQYSVPKFGRAVIYIMQTIFPNSILVAERNSMGVAAIQIIEEGMGSEASMRIYKEATDSKAGLRNQPYGIHLTQNIRELFFNDILRLAIVNELDKIHDESIISEITTLRMTKKGRVDHEEGEHDDTLIAYLYTRWFLSYAENKELYIDPIIIGSNLNKKKKSIEHFYEAICKPKELTMEDSFRKIMDVDNEEFEYKSHRDRIRHQYDLVNNELREAFERSDDLRYVDLDNGEVDLDKVVNRFESNFKNNQTVKDIEEFRTKEDIQSKLEKEDLEKEIEKLEKNLKKSHEDEEKKTSIMKDSLSSFFGDGFRL